MKVNLEENFTVHTCKINFENSTADLSVVFDMFRYLNS